MTTPALDDYNGWADFVRNQLGVNVIPANYREKVPLKGITWKEWQTQPIPLELHNEWKTKNMFKDGMAIVLGNVFHNDKTGSYLACLDTDNGLATKSIALSAKETLVQQRKNALDRAHSYFYSPRPVKRKPSGANNKDLKDRYDNNLAPKFELRCMGDVVYTGKHESGYYYEIVGLDKSAILSLEQVQGIENRVNDICNKFGLINSVDQPASDLFKEEFEVYEGQNRSRELKRAMCSLLQRNWGIIEFNVIKGLASDWHNKHCNPPYTNGIFERNWKQSLEFVGRKREDNTRAERSEAQPQQNPIENWSEKLLEKYEKLHSIVLDNLPDLWFPLEFALSIKTVLNIEGCTLPFAGIILGPPGSLKTAVIQLFRGYKHTFYTDSFTAKSIISHSSAVKREKLREIDMLPRMENKLFLTPELAPIFSARDELLLETLGMLTRLLDGHGYESDTGAQGHRGYDRDIMFCWLGAVVEIPYKVHRHLSRLGPKLYFFRLPRVERSEDDYLYYCEHVSDTFPARLQKIRVALHEYLACFDMIPKIKQSGGLPKIPFGDNNNDQTLNQCLMRLANLLARLRAIVPTFHTYDTQGADYAYGVAIIEDANRAITQLKNLARGHALSQGRDYLTVEDDLAVVIHTVLSTASIERSTIFEILIANKGKLTTSQICDFLNTTKPTALRTMTELKATGLVSMYEGDNNNEAQIQLKPEFGWFLGDRFEELKSRKEKTPLYTPNTSIHNIVYDYTINKKINQNRYNSLQEGLRGEISLREKGHIKCNKCDFLTDSRFDFKWHKSNSHGGAWTK